MAQITHPAESCSSRSGETDTRWTKLNHFISRDVKKQKKKTWFVYSPLAIRLRTESERCVDGSSPCVVTALTATEEKDSDVLKERYSCIMYSGYLLRWFTDRFLSAKLASRPAWYLSPWVERDKTPEKQKRNVQKTVKTLTSIFTKNHKIFSSSGDRKRKDLLGWFLPPAGFRLEWCSVQTELQSGLFIVDSCPLMTPDHSRHLNSPSDHQSTSQGRKKKTFSQGHCPVNPPGLSHSFRSPIL